MPHQKKFSSAVVITGPTAVGKTEVAIELAAQVPAEIVSADSRQVFRYMDIGTAKPTPEQRERVPHYFIDICDPDEEYNAGRYAREGRSVVQQILEAGKLPIIVGGSGLYLRALLEGFSSDLPSDLTRRQELKRRARQEGSAALHEELARLDPKSAKRLHPNDTQRIVRALEVFYAGRQPLSDLWQNPPQPAPFAYSIFCLNLDRQVLYDRIDRRVERMMAQGLIEECRRLLELGYSPGLNALQTVGYQETFEYFRGGISIEELKESIQRHSRQYAKRQLTWFRRIKDCRWVLVRDHESAAEVASAIGNFVFSNGI